MKIGMKYPQEWKLISEKLSLSLADFVYGLIIEDLFMRLEASSFSKQILLQNDKVLCVNAYRKKTKERMNFSYALDKKNTNTFQVERFMKEILARENDISYTYKIEQSENLYDIYLQADYFNMCIPISMQIEQLSYLPKITKHVEYKTMLGEHAITCYCCSKESVLCENIFEIMKKLELIADMEAYAMVNQMIQTQTLDGKYITDELMVYIEKEPKIFTLKRLEQMKSYGTYSYMKKRWKQYVKCNEIPCEEWEVVHERILKFVSPVWTALCNNEIFFGDWMPEIQRFLE